MSPAEKTLVSLKMAARRLAAQNTLNFFPLPHNMRGYSLKKLGGDTRAGVNVALLAFPQGMAYAMIAGLPIQYGIFGSAVAAIMGSFFAGSRYITLGPTNATSVILGSSFAALTLTDSEKLAVLPIILMMVGVFLVAAAYLRAANLTQYISRTVVTGYITAASVLIIANQVRKVLGFTFDDDEKGSTFVDVVYYSLLHLDDTVLVSVIFSTMTFLLYWSLNKYLSKLPNVAITLLVMSICAFLYKGHLAGMIGTDPELLKTLNAVSFRDWSITLPALDFDAISRYASIALAVALLCVLEGTSIGKSLAARSGARLDSNQEMYNIGMANIGCSILNGMPASGSLTRSVLNWSSGAHTPLSSLINGIVCVLGVVLVGRYIEHIPQTALAVLIIFIGISLIKKRAIQVALKSTRSDATTFIVTFGSGLLFPLDTAIYFGVIVSIILFLRKASSPELVEYGFTDEGQLAELEDKEERTESEVSIVHVEGNLYFGASEIFYDQVRRICQDPNLKVIICKMRNAHHLDATSVMAIEELALQMREQDRTLILSEIRRDVIRIFRNAGTLDVIGRENLFPDNHRNLTMSTAYALKRAQEILGDSMAKVRIYVSPGKQQGQDKADGESDDTASP